MKWLFFVLALIATPPAMAAERILAMTPHICEIMYAIGAGREVVGAGEHCDYPEAVKALPRIANYRQVYVEAALRLKPTLAVALRTSLPGVGRLKAAGVRVIASNPLTVDAVFKDMLRLGKITGHAGKAAVAVAGLRRRLQMLKRKQPGPKLRVFYEIWHAPLMAAGGTSLINSVLHELNLKNVFADLPLEGPRISVESVLLARPDVIILSSESDVHARKRFWKKRFGKWPVKFAVADANLLHRPGPRIVPGMEQLQAAMKATSHD